MKNTELIKIRIERKKHSLEDIKLKRDYDRQFHFTQIVILFTIFVSFNNMNPNDQKIGFIVFIVLAGIRLFFHVTHEIKFGKEYNKIYNNIDNEYKKLEKLLKNK